MFNITSRWIFAFLLLSVQTVCTAQTSEPLQKLLKEASHQGDFVQPSEQTLKKAEALFRQLFHNTYISDEMIKDWASIGFELIEFKENSNPLYILREQAHQKKGRGFYLFRPINEGQTLHAPHSFSDLYTRDITLKLFLSKNVKAAAWNTVSRHKMDSAHTTNTYFTAFARAFAKEMPNEVFIQLHGFAPQKRTSLAASTADVILSSGSEFPTLNLQKLAQCLKHRLDFTVRVCFIDVFELCGTTNVIGQLLRHMQHQGFIHIEMNKDVRKRLLNDSALLASLRDCLPV